MVQLDRILGKTIGTSLTGCIEWSASLDRNGYGKLGLDGRTRQAHGVLYELFNGPVPPGLLIMHSCDNPKCVNVFHMSVGTQKQNMQDCAKKGRMVSYWGLRSHCFSGHEYSQENTRVTSTGARSCRECERLRGIERRKAAR